MRWWKAHQVRGEWPIGVIVMATWKLVKSESMILARDKALELAAKHANLPRSPVEREFDERRMTKLVTILKNGLAIPFNWATVEYDGQTLRMNGQHSSKALLEVAGDIPDKLGFHFDRFEAPDRNAMVSLFRQYDQRWSGRSARDVAGAYQGLKEELASCNRKISKLAVEAISWTWRSVDGLEGIPTGDDAYQLFHRDDCVPFVLWLNGIINGRKELMRREVVAAMFKTYEVSQSAASSFWREVSFGPDFFTDDSKPAAVLIGELSRAAEERDFREKEFPNLASYYKKAVKAWNAFCAGQHINTLKVTKGKGWPDIAPPENEGDREAA
jgi:hypothetical protein